MGPFARVGPWLGTAAVVGALLALSHSPPDWSAYAPASCMPDDCFCEAIRATTPRQPSNSWSSMSFVLLGFLIIGNQIHRRASGDPEVQLRDETSYRVLFGVVAILIGLGGWALHATLTFPGQWIDVMSMYLLPTYLVLFNEVRAGRLDRSKLLLAWLAASVVLGAGVWYLPLFRRAGFGALVLAYVISERWFLARHPRQMRTGLLLACLGSLAVAFGIWNLDRHRIMCAPNSIVQGHAIWHLLCCVAAYFIYRYYLSERPAARSTPAS